MELFTDPWPHIIIDNALPESELQALYKRAQQMPENDSGISRENLGYDPLVHLNLSQYFDVLPHRKSNKWQRLTMLTRTQPNVRYPIHCEIDYKLMSAVVYLGPNKNNGTRLFDGPNDDDFVKECIWKPNRLFLFCGMDAVTYHDWTSNNLDRYILGWFIVDGNINPTNAF